MTRKTSKRDECRSGFWNLPLALVGALLLIGLPAGAVTITVNTADDTVADDGACSLREAVAAANANMSSGAAPGECAAGSGPDTIVFQAALAGATFSLATVGDSGFGRSALVVNSDVTIDGGAPGVTITRGGGAQRLFLVTSAGDLTLRTITLTNGLASGGTGGRSGQGGGGGGGAGLGGAIFSQGAVTLESCMLSGNVARGGNGGAATLGTIKGGGGGGGLTGNGQNGQEPTSTEGVGGDGGGPLGGLGGPSGGGNGQTGGVGGGGGGGGRDTSMSGSGGFGGDGGFGGGGGGGGEVGDKTNGGGDGVFGGGGGGGGANAGRSGIGRLGGGDGGDGIEPLGGSGGGGGGLGGAIFVESGTLTIVGSTFFDNEARGGSPVAVTQIVGVTGLPGEAGIGLGGAIFLRDGDLNATNSTFSANRAVAGTGGAIVGFDGTIVVESSTLTANEALGTLSTAGGILISGTATLDLSNSIVANSVGRDVIGRDVTVPPTSSGDGNLIENALFFHGTVVSMDDPQLGSLADNGGPTETHALAPSSPAVDAGVNGSLAVDQRGVLRPIDGDGDTFATIDIGAFEVERVDMTLTKSDSADPAAVGVPFSYTFTASNNSSSFLADNVTIVDTLPAGVSFVSGDPGCVEAPAGTVTCTIPTLAAGTSASRTINVMASPALAGSTVTNNATVAAVQLDPVANNDASEMTSFMAQADLSVTKTDGVTSAVPGQSVIYTIVASNAGPSAEPSATLSDVFPPDLACAYMSTSAGGATGNTNGFRDIMDTLTMPVGSSVTYTATCDIDSDATGTLSNEATVTGSLLDPNVGNNSATDADTALVATADVAVTKTDGVTSAVPGETVTYFVLASNRGPSTDPSVSVADAFPSALSCTYTSAAAGGATGNTNGSGDLADTLSMPSGSSVTYTAICDIDSDATGTLSNTATIAGSVADSVAGNNSATDDDTALDPESDVSITKTDGVTSAVPGEMVTYTIVASNAGPSDDPSVSVTDTFPADLTCSYTSVAAGGATGNTNGSGNLGDTLSMPSGSSVTYTAICDIDSAATGTLSNTATIAGSVTDLDASNNSATDDDTALAAEADVSITKTDSVTSAVSGQSTLTYQIVASNAGPSDDPSVSVTDTFPADQTCSYTSVAVGGATGNTNGSGNLGDTLSMPSGSSVTYTATCEIDPAATGTLSNTATVASSVADPDAGNNSATDDDTVLVPTADVSITKDDGLATAMPGDPVTYTILASNAGPSNAPGTAVSDAFPAGLTGITWTCVASAGSACAAAGAGDIVDTVDLLVGGTATYTATGTVMGGFVGDIVNTATISAAAGVTDPDATNDSAMDTTVVTSPSMIMGEKVATGSPRPGATIAYVITLINTSDDEQLDNPGDEMVDVLPPELTPVSAMASSGTATIDAPNNTVTWNGEIPGNGTVEITIDAQIDINAAGQTVGNQATFFFDADGDGTNESSGVTDDPATPDGGDATTIRVLSVVDIPTLGDVGLVMLMLLLLASSLLTIRHHGSPP